MLRELFSINRKLFHLQIHGDLEKDDEDDYSGSGYGDDDEDTRHSPVNRNNFNKGHTSDSDHKQDISGSGDGPTFEDNDDDDDLWTDTSKPELPETPHIQEEHSQFAWLIFFIIYSSTLSFFSFIYINIHIQISHLVIVNSFIIQNPVEMVLDSDVNRVTFYKMLKLGH